MQAINIGQSGTQMHLFSISQLVNQGYIHIYIQYLNMKTSNTHIDYTPQQNISEHFINVASKTENCTKKNYTIKPKSDVYMYQDHKTTLFSGNKLVTLYVLEAILSNAPLAKYIYI